MASTNRNISALALSRAQARSRGERSVRAMRLLERRRGHTSGRQALRAVSTTATGPTVEGYGALFNDESVIAGLFREVILPGAFKDSIARDDIRVAFNHSPHYIFGRTSAGTATISEDAAGLKYSATPPDATWARDVVESIIRRDVTGSSFQFVVEHDEDETWDFESQTKLGKLPLRTIKRAKLWECGPVAWPAYENTTATAGRSASSDTLATVHRDCELLERELHLDFLEHELEFGAPSRRQRPKTWESALVHRECELLELELEFHVCAPSRRQRPLTTEEAEIALFACELDVLQLGNLTW